MQQKISNILKVFILLLLSIQCEAQKYDWVNFFAGQDNQKAISMNVDSMGNQYATFSFDSQIKFDTLIIKDSSNYSRLLLYKGLVLKQNKEGKVLWYKIIRLINNTNTRYPNVQGSLFNSKGNLLVFVESEYDLKIGEDTIKKKTKNTSGVFMIEFNTAGKIVNSVMMLEGRTTIYDQDINFSKHFTSDKYDNIYLSLEYGHELTVYDKSGDTIIGTDKSSGNGGTYIIKFSNSGQKFDWYARIPYNVTIFINDLKIDINGNVYTATEWWHHPSHFPFTFMGKTLSQPKTSVWINSAYVFVWDKNGKEKNCFSMTASGGKSRFMNLAVHDSNSVFISGMYEGDTARFDTLTKKNRKYGLYYFMARYHANGRVKWVKTEDTCSSETMSAGLGDAFHYVYRHKAFMTNYKDTFFYLSFYMNDKKNETIIWDGQKYPPNIRSEGINMKVDEKGNILWAFRTLFPFSAMGTDDDDNLYFQGKWNGSDTLKLGTFISRAVNYDSYIGKTFDYAIYRGDISKGPYCAGDSLYIPYTKTGDYADSNIFFAEISDELGNFTGKEREIGRLKSKNNGTIRGVLPMFKVASSGSYRIRIRSTSPQVQSFYKKDTLRLLIYSRDKADPGPPEWICRGDTIKLNTYGGTKWTWNPQYRMDNPNLRQPSVWPIKDTTYKIIIADSSGCGAPDTAYKKIYIHRDPKALLAFTEINLCKNTTLKIPAHFTGGDSNYHWQWYELPVGKQAVLLHEGKLKQNDTLNYASKLDSIKKSEKLALVLWDECTSKHDTVYITLNLKKPYLGRKLSDTVVCDGALVNLTAITNAPVGSYYWQWKDMVSNKVLSTFGFLNLKVNQTYKIKLSLISTCNVDSSEFTVRVRLPLKTNIYSSLLPLNDTIICFGKSLKLNATGKYGDSAGYEFKWYLEKKSVSNSNTFNLNTAYNFIKGGEKKTLKLILNDNCSFNDDSISKIITVIPGPIADFSFGTACNTSPIQFTFTGSKPDAPITTTFKWDFAGTGSSTLENPLHKFAAGTSSSVLTLSSSNGCTDNITKTIDIKPQSKADFTATDVCESDSVIFINKSKDAIGYTWKFGDGQISKFQNPKHKYQIITSTTFNVTLVAIGSGGCSDSVINAVTINENPKSDFTYTPGGAGKMDFKATQTGVKNYRWLFGNGDSAKVTTSNHSYTYKKTSNYKVCLQLTNTAGCVSETCQQLTITGGISSLSKPGGFKIYPNPNTGNFTIEIENPSNNGSIEIYDMLGELVKKVERVEKVTTFDFNVADGIYLIKVKNENVVWIQKIIINN